MTMGGNMQDVGLRAVLKDAGKYEADAARVNRATARVADGIAQAAAHSIKAHGLLGRMLSPLTNVGFAIFGVQMAVRSISQLTDGIFGASMAWEVYEAQFGRMIGTTELGIQKLEELDRFARRTPLSLPDVVEAAKQIRAYGFANEEIIPILQNVGDAVAVLGTEKLPNIVRALGQMRAATVINSRDMLQLTEAGIDAWRALADAAGVSVAVIQKAVEQRLIPSDIGISVILKAMEEQYGGMMDIQSKTLDGMLRNLGDWFFRARQLFAKGMAGEIKFNVGDLLSEFDKPETLANIEAAGAAVGEAFGSALIFVRNLSGVLVTILKTVWEIIQPVIGLVGTLAQVLQDNLGTALQVVSVLLARVVVLRLQALAGYLVATGLAAAASAREIVSSMVSITVATIAATASVIRFAVVSLLGALSSIGKFAVSVTTASVSLLVQFIPAVTAATVAVFTRFIPTMIALSTILSGVVLKALASASVSIAGLGKAAIAAAGAVAASFLRVVIPAMLAAAAAAVGAIAPIVIAIGLLIGAVSLLAKAWQDNWGGVQGITAEVLGWLGDRISDFINWLSDLPVIGPAVRQVSDWVGGAVHAFQTGVPKLTKVATDSVGDIADQFRKGFPAVQDAIRGLFEIPSGAIDTGEIEKQLGGIGLSSDIERAKETLRQLVDGIAAGEGGWGAFKSASRNALADAQDAIEVLKDSVRDLELALREAEQAMQDFSDPRLIGMQAVEDEIFELEMAIKRARLEELKTGKDLRRTARDLEDTFDMLAAQQRELEEGIPVPFQRLMWELDRQRREQGKIQKEEELSDVERLQRIKEIKELERDLTFEPLRRTLRETFEELTGANREITFDEAMRGLMASNTQAQALKYELFAQKALLNDAEELLRLHKSELRDIETAHASINAERGAGLELEGGIFGLYQQETEELGKQIDLMIKRHELGLMGEGPAGPPPPNEPHNIGKRWPYMIGAPGMAGGGDVLDSGFFRVGERGEELVHLPRGASVIPNRNVQNMTNSSSWNDTFNITEARNPIDVVDSIRKYQSFRRMLGGRR